MEAMSGQTSNFSQNNVMPMWLWSMLVGGSGKWLGGENPYAPSSSSSGTSSDDYTVVKEPPVMSSWMSSLSENLGNLINSQLSKVSDSNKNMFDSSLGVNPLAWALGGAGQSSGQGNAGIPSNLIPPVTPVPTAQSGTITTQTPWNANIGRPTLQTAGVNNLGINTPWMSNIGRPNNIY